MPEEVDLVIIGAGAAGLAAALYAARARLTAVTVERFAPGGQLINVDRIENYPGFAEPVAGYDFGPRLADQALEAGARIEFGEVQSLAEESGRWQVGGDLEFSARAVILACGSSLARLGVPGEDRFEGHGVSYCATCDGEFFRDQEIAVVGGGDSALDEARYLSDICSRIHLIHRGPELTASRIAQERARADPKMKFLPHSVVEEIDGGDMVEAVSVLNEATAERRRLPVAGVFVYVGLQPNTGLVSGLLALDAAGHVPTDIWMATARPGLFAAGDIRQHSARQIATCVGDGITAAIAAERYLRGASQP